MLHWTVVRSITHVAIAVITCALGIAAQNVPLSLADCQSLAEAAPSAVTAARIETQIARSGITVARSAFLPQSGVTSGYTYNTPIASQPQAFIAFNGVREYQVLGAASLEIDTSGRLRASLARAKADQESRAQT